MLKGLYDAAAGMKARLAVQDVIASNLTNAGTNGFQQQIVSIQEHLLTSLAETGTGPAATGVCRVVGRAFPRLRSGLCLR